MSHHIKIRKVRDAQGRAHYYYRDKVKYEGQLDLLNQIEKQCSLTRGDVLAVSSAVSELLGELLTDSCIVDLGYGGRMHLTFKSRMADLPENCNPSQIYGLKVVWVPYSEHRRKGKSIYAPDVRFL